MARKKRTNTVAIILIAIAVLFIINQGSFPLAISGASTLSISEANLQSSNQFFSGQAWLVTFTRGTLAQSYFGDFSPQDVQSANSGDEQTVHDFTVDVEYSDTNCVYEFQGTNLNTPIYDLQLIDWLYVPIVNPCTGEEGAERGLNNGLFVGRDGFTCFAIGYSTLSPVANIDSPDIESEFTVSIQTDAGFSASETFNTLSGQTQGFVGDFAFLQWQGNLVSGQACPDKDPFKSAYINGRWRVVSKSQYSSYETSFETLNNLMGSNPNFDNVEARVNTVIQRATEARVSHSFGSIINEFSQSNGRVAIATQTPIELPVSTLYLKADSVGIHTPNPEIVFSTNPNSECFASGSGNGLISLGIENIGDENGGFSIGATCPSPFFVTNVQGTLGAGDSRTINLPLSGSGDSIIESQCEVFLTVLGETQTRSVGVCVDPLITCTVPYPQKFCAVNSGSDVIKQCSQNGATSQILETCGTDEFCDNGECIEETGGGGGGGLLNGISNFLKDLFGGTFGLLKSIKFFIVGISAILVTFASFDFLQAIKSLKRNKQMRWIVSIIIGFGVGWILNIFIGSPLFWIMAIASLLVLFFSKQIKGFLK